MARPQKQGMDYFPHDTDASNDEKIDGLRMLYGNDGYAFYFILLERIYRTPNFELDISAAETRQILSRKVEVTPDKFAEMLDYAVRVGCFCGVSYAERRVLTSDGIKKRAASVIAKRQKMASRYEKEVSAAETNQKPSRNAAESTQSKVKESKEENSKVKESIKDNEASPADAVVSVEEKENGLLETGVLVVLQEDILPVPKAKASRVKTGIGAAHTGGGCDVELTVKQAERWPVVEMWLKESCPRVLAMKETITAKRFFEMETKYGMESCMSVLEDMENYRDLNKKYVSAPKTMLSWLKIRSEKQASRTYTQPVKTGGLAQTEEVSNQINSLIRNGIDIFQRPNHNYE